MADENTQCCERVSDGARWPSFSQCSRNGKFERNGKWYCKTHDPVSKKEKRDEQDRRWKERYSHEKALREDAAQKEKIKTLKAECFDGLLSALKMVWHDWNLDECESPTGIVVRDAITKADSLA